jgi:hypothetical protein
MGDGTTGDDLTKAYRIDITFDLTYTNWDGSYLSALIKNISLQIGADQTQRNIVWYSDSSSAGKVQLALKSAMPGSDFPSQYQEFEATSESTVVSGLNSNKSIITGLAANTEYVYRVGNDDGWSDAYGFKTQNFSGSFSFLAAGDPQMGYTAISNDLAGWTNTLQKSHANFPDAGFILSLGDNINHLGNESEYEAFFGPETLKSLTLATVYGNHDAGINFSQHFNPPNVSDYGITPDSGSASGDYWYIYNNTLFMSLNSMNMSTAEHQQFMIEAIAQNPSVKWKIVVMHFPLFSAVTLNGSHDDLRAALAPIFSSLGIDVVLSGHDHAYTRTYMIGGPSDPTGQIPNIPEEGVPSEITAPLKGEVLYVSLNSSSGSLCIPVTNDVLPFVAVKNQESVPNISRINITDNSFTITTYRTTDMNVVDTFTINKTSSSSTIKDVSLNIGADQTQRLITWYSDSATAGELQLAPASAMTASDFPATYQSFPATRADSEATGFGTNKATITGLTANTAYVYRVGNSDGWSPVYHFSTESFNDADFSFLFAGDPQIGSSGNAGNDTAGWTNTLNKAAQWFSGASFLISAGDQVESYNNEAEYDGFFAPDTLRSLTLAPNIGNHDSDGINYKQHFSVPNAAINSGDTNAGGDYWYSYNNVLFMSLNSNNLSTAQHQAFLTSAIAAYKAQSGGNDPVWKIVTFHHSIYSTAGHAVESDILQRRNELSPVFKNLGVDAVLMGHDHVYTRSYMMDGTTPIFDGYTAATGNQYAAYSKAADSGATFYLTANSASGSKFYAIQNLNFPFMAAQNQENTPNITKVDVAEDALTFTTYRTGASNTVNDVVDTFTLSKQAAQTVDKSELNNLIIEAETEAEADYTAESWAAFAAALNAARTLSLDGAATQGQVDAAVTALRSAMDSLIPVQAPADKVLASISTSATSVDTDPEYTVSLRGMDRVSTVKLTFTADGNLLEFKNLETLNGFTALSGVTWKDLDNNLWQGEVTLVYAPGTQTTLTSTAQVDVAKIIHYAKGLGDAAMTLTGISVTGLVTGSNGDEMKYINSGIEPGKGSAVTSIGESYSVYDLNRDGKVDQIDLAVVVLYCQIDSNDPRWSTLVIVYDTKGEAITAALCDVNADGAVDMLDLLDLYLNYTA